MTTLSEHLSRLGSKGGKATAANRTAAERRAAAKKAIEARWAKERAEPKAIKDGASDLMKKASQRAKQKKEKAET